MTDLIAWGAAAASAGLIALLLARGRLPWRLFLDALAIGLTLGAAVSVALAPFDLRANPLHFSALTLAFGFAGLPEEGVRLLGVSAFLRGHYLARDQRDIVFAAGALSLGFAALENLFYLANAGGGWATLSLARAVTAMPLHLFLGLAAGLVVARLPAGWRGAALGAAAWLVLASIHGVYDFAVFAGAPGAQPEALRRFVAASSVDAATALRALLCAAEAAAALAGGAAVAAVGWPREAPRGRLGRLVGSRALGWLVGGVLTGGAVVALGVGALAGVMLESADLFLRVAVYAVMPLALGLLFIAGPASREPAPRAARAAVAAGLVLVAAAAWVWGPGAWRRLEALRFEARAARLTARGDYKAAIDNYGWALAVEPGRIESLSQRAEAYAALKRYDAALADLDAALRMQPGVIALYVQRAEMDQRRNAPADAARDLDAALARKAGDSELLALRAQARLQAGDAKGARDDLVEASRKAPDDAVVRRVYAAWRVDSGDLDGALRELNADLHARPADSVAAFQRGRVWLYKGEPARARADFIRADVKPGFLYPALWRFLAEVQLKQDGAPALRARLAAAKAEWPAPVARMLMGEIDLAAARAAAADEGERCEADFYFAMSRLRADGPEANVARLAAALKECPTGFIEYEGAKAQLRRLGE
jgi:predicted Zn-dependent protease